MAIIKPLKAIRPQEKNFAEEISSPPYDIVSRPEASSILSNNPFSFLSVTRSDVYFDNDKIYSNEVYSRAKSNFEDFLRKKLLFLDEEKSFYLYQITTESKTQIGITGLFSTEEYRCNKILKHELTRKIKEADRTNHIKTTSVQTGQVYLMHTHSELIVKLKKDILKQSKLLYDFYDENNINHKIFKIETKRNSSIENAFSKIKHLYIVDGHHRAAAALNSGCKYFLATAFSSLELHTGCCNRLLLDPANINEITFLNKLTNYFDVKISDEFNPNGLSMFLTNRWYDLRLKIYPGNATVNHVDSYIIQKFIFEKIFGINNPTETDRIEYIRNTKPKEYFEKKVLTKHAFAAFLLKPPTIENIIDIALEGDVMPPKSTWFWPKMRDGLIIYNLTID